MGAQQHPPAGTEGSITGATVIKCRQQPTTDRVLPELPRSVELTCANLCELAAVECLELEPPSQSRTAAMEGRQMGIQPSCWRRRQLPLGLSNRL